MPKLFRFPEDAGQAWRTHIVVDFVDYAKYVHGFRPAGFQRRWARAMADPGVRRLVIVAPPESGKTAWCIAYCSWLIGKDPSVHIGYVGNTAAQAFRQSVAVRDTVRSNPRFREVLPHVVLDPVKGTGEQEWFVRRPDPGDKDPTFLASGFRGPLLGARLDLLVLDDYSDQENTSSPEQQERAWEWLQQNALTRLNPDTGRLICIQTRWADGDVVGQLEGVGAKVLQFPALSESGEPLWPERWRREGLEQRRAEMGSRLFDMHYMGNVLPRDGHVFKPQWWSYWDFSDGEHTKLSWIVLSVDTASKTGISNDYSAATVWGMADPGPTRKHYLLHAWRDKVEFPDLVRMMLALNSQWHPHYILIEDTGAGQALFQELRGRSLPVRATRPTADKVTRAIGVTAEVEAGRIFLPRHAGWLEDFRYELETFPRSRHDDWVDSMVQYLEWAIKLAGADLRIW